MFRIITVISLVMLSGFIGIDIAYACEGCPGETPTDVKIREFFEYTMFFAIIAFSLFTYFYLWKKSRSKQ